MVSKNIKQHQFNITSKISNRFIEQAEYIDASSFFSWHSQHPDEEHIIKKLTQSGAKLITGPRGSGKTTLLLKAHYELCKNLSSKTFSIYVNFKNSLKLEPLYQSTSDAMFWFNQWVLHKIYLGIFESLKLSDSLDKLANSYLLYSYKEIAHIIGQLELGYSNVNQLISKPLSIQILEEEVNKVLTALNMKRSVLLLDDAAHAFSEVQQRDFFDLFRKIKSKTISPKAAIYPGITNFSPAFHVGHDAEEIDIWIKPFESNYLNFFKEILEKRLPQNVYDSLINQNEALLLICHASFGIPRALLNIIRLLYKGIDDEDTESIANTKINRTALLNAINKTTANALGIYKTLEYQLPIYSKFVQKGEIIFEKTIELIKEYNKDKNLDRTTIFIALNRPVPSEIDKVFGFYQYAGLALYDRKISRGVKGTFDLYAIHTAALIDRNAIIVKKRYPLTDYSLALASFHSHEFKRVSSNVLVDNKDLSVEFKLALPPCQKCDEPRISQEAKFCIRCGSKLKSISLFESLVSKDISFLPITEKRSEMITSQSKIKTIKDVLMDNDFRELRSVKGIGPYWAKRIYAYAEEFIS